MISREHSREIEMNTTTYRPLLTPRDAARALSVSMSTLRRMRDTGRLKPIKISDRRLGYRPDDLDALLLGKGADHA